MWCVLHNIGKTKIYDRSSKVKGAELEVPAAGFLCCVRRGIIPFIVNSKRNKVHFIKLKQQLK